MAGPVSQIATGFKIHNHPGMVSEPYLEGIAGGTVPNGAIIKNSSGALVVAANGDAATEVVGISRGAYTVGQAMTYTPFWSQLLWEATLDGGTTTGTTLTVATHKWNAYGIGLDAGNSKYFVNFDDTAATHILFVVIGFIDPVGTVRGRVLVSTIPSQTVWGI